MFTPLSFLPCLPFTSPPSLPVKQYSPTGPDTLAPDTFGSNGLAEERRNSAASKRDRVTERGKRRVNQIVRDAWNWASSPFITFSPSPTEISLKTKEKRGNITKEKKRGEGFQVYPVTVVCVCLCAFMRGGREFICCITLFQGRFASG